MNMNMHILNDGMIGYEDAMLEWLEVFVMMDMRVIILDYSLVDVVAIWHAFYLWNILSNAMINECLGFGDDMPC